MQKKNLETEYDKASKTIIKNAYLDDTLVLTNDKKELPNLVKQVEQVYSTSSKPCKKFTSNLQSCLDELQAEQHNPKKVILCLGTIWDSVTDQITFKFIESDLTIGNIDPTKLTKSSLLSHIARVYVPCGLLSGGTIKDRR